MGKDGSVDQDDGQAKTARGIQLGPRATAARVLGDDMADPVLRKQAKVTLKGERPFGNDRGRIWQGQLARRIDQTQQIMMLGPRRKRGKMLLADGQKDPSRGLRQGANGIVNPGNMGPKVAWTWGPKGPLQRQQGCAGLRASGNRICAHLRSEWMGGVDHMGNCMIADIGDHAINPTKAARSRRQGLGHRGVCPAGIGKRGGQARAGQQAGQLACLGRAAKKKDVGRNG